MVFSGQITFSNSPQKNSTPPPKKIGLGALKSYFSAPKRKNLGSQAEKPRFFFFFRRRRVMVFDGQIIFLTPPKKLSVPPKNIPVSAWVGDQSAAFFFRRPKPKIGFFGGRPRSKGLVIATLFSSFSIAVFSQIVPQPMLCNTVHPRAGSVSWIYV